MHMNTCEWCGRKWNDGPIYNILVGTHTARAKTVCSEKCKKEIIEEKGDPTVEAKNEWGRKTKERRLEKEAAKNAKEEEKFQKELQVARKQQAQKNQEEWFNKQSSKKKIQIGCAMGNLPLGLVIWMMSAKNNSHELFIFGCILIFGSLAYINAQGPKN